MNKSILRGFPLLTIIITLGLSISLASPALAKGRAFKLPPHAVEIAPGLFYLGVAEDVDFRPVQGFAIIHPRRDFSHKPGHGEKGNGGGKKGNGGGGSSCFAFLANGAKWKVTENYVVAPMTDSLSAAFVTRSIANALTAWDDEVGVDIFGVKVNGIVDGADEVQPDGKNEFLFGDLDSPGSIAVTIVWGIFLGPPRGRELVEWDMVCDDVAFDWSESGEPGKMDFINIVTHEVGHAAGMGHPTDDCTEETMYRFASLGETKKGTLNAGDKAGIKKLYK